MGLYTIPGTRERWRFGNIRDGIATILSAATFPEFCALFGKIKDGAQKQDWYSLLNTGCLGDYFPTIDQEKPVNTFAHAWQKIAAHIQKRLEEFNLADAVALRQ